MVPDCYQCAPGAQPAILTIANAYAANTLAPGPAALIRTVYRGGPERMFFRRGMSRGAGLGQEVGASPAQVFQAALLVGAEGAEPLGVGIHPNREAFPGGGIELHLVMACRRGQQREEGARRGQALPRLREALVIAVLHLIEKTRLAVVHQGVVRLGEGEVEIAARASLAPGAWQETQCWSSTG